MSCTIIIYKTRTKAKFSHTFFKTRNIWLETLVLNNHRRPFFQMTSAKFIIKTFKLKIVYHLSIKNKIQIVSFEQ
jgi:hypothetical protein